MPPILNCHGPALNNRQSRLNGVLIPLVEKRASLYALRSNMSSITLKTRTKCNKSAPTCLRRVRHVDSETIMTARGSGNTLPKIRIGITQPKLQIYCCWGCNSGICSQVILRYFKFEVYRIKTKVAGAVRSWWSIFDSHDVNEVPLINNPIAVACFVMLCKSDLLLTLTDLTSTISICIDST